ncbi:MAG: hypothetical protein ACKVOW_14935 [Chitinophagaceae bacterium]
MKKIVILALLFCVVNEASSQNFSDTIHPSRTEIITPIHKSSFNNNNECKERRQEGNPQIINGYQVFNGSMDGNRQVDPQIAVGGGFILHGSNSGIIIYTKTGAYVSGVSQKCFNNGIDPKLYFDIHNNIFVFDLWWYYDTPKIKPVNISISETNNPTGAWNTYPVPATNGVDGGGIGYSQKWIGYSFPGGTENTFILRVAEAKSGKPATIYHFNGSLGHPVFTQDAIDDLYFFDIDDDQFIIRKISEDANGNPYCKIVSKKRHNLTYINYPLPSAQKGTEQKVSSGDRNPKNLVVQNGYIWFSQAVNCEGHSAVQWHQISIKDGKIIQTGIIRSDTTNYIQTTLAVNKKNDVLIGFQEVNSQQYISPRFAYRLGTDKPGTIRKIISLGEGKGYTDGESWGDYSSSVIDGDNLLDLWTIQSIANEKGKGETIIAKIPFTKKRIRL